MKKGRVFIGVAILLLMMVGGYFLGPGQNIVKLRNAPSNEANAEPNSHTDADTDTPVPKKVLKEYWSRRLPKNVSLLVFKLELVLEVWSLENNKWVFVESYPILGASGTLGPKLREGDFQVPEGIYKVIGLNPNSRFCRSLLIDYPNEFDWAKARIDGRTQLGGSICVHGSNVSIGCVAMGDEVSKDLFWLASQIGMKHLKVIIAPWDFRKKKPENLTYDPEWTKELYEILTNELKKY
ncbi:MAG TPA: L,D-transpeptidase family protein [Bacillota bacterium]|nr:L,D-transpeptidase family protein [Bacillota bacterium]